MVVGKVDVHVVEVRGWDGGFEGEEKEGVVEGECWGGVEVGDCFGVEPCCVSDCRIPLARLVL